MSINWIYLLIGGFFEAVFAVSLAKLGTSSSKVLWFLVFVVAISVSMWMLFRAMSGEKAIAVGTAYAVWGAIGVFFTVVAGILLFGEPTSFWRLFFLTTLVLSVAGLQMVSN